MNYYLMTEVTRETAGGTETSNEVAVYNHNEMVMQFNSAERGMLRRGEVVAETKLTMRCKTVKRTVLMNAAAEQLLSTK